MSKTKFSTRQIVCMAVSAFIVLLVLAINIALGTPMLSKTVTNFLYGYTSGETSKVQITEGDKLCQEIESEGAVLLKNGIPTSKVLPLTNTTINVFGWGSSDGGFVMGGSGSSSTSGVKDHRRSLMAGLKQAGFTCNPELEDYYKKFKSGRDENNSINGNYQQFFELIEPKKTDYSNALLNNAIAFSDTAVMVLSRRGGEGKDLPFVQYKDKGSTDSARHYLEISKEEEDMIAYLSENYVSVVVLLNTCNTMELGFLDNYDNIACLSIGAPGQSGTVSIGKILKGEINPSGRTVDTYAYAMESAPSYVTAAANGVTGYSNGGNYIDYAEGIYVGYRYYETAATEGYINYDEVVQYPFGYGLSYTNFSYDIAVSVSTGNKITKDTEIVVSVRITNEDNVAGKDVVQVYVNAPYDKTTAPIEKSSVVLVSFGKSEMIEPGESKSLSIGFDAYSFASYDTYDVNDNDHKGYELEAGDYEVRVQSDSHNVLSGRNAVTKLTCDGVKFDTDPDSGAKVKNRFSGEDAYLDCSIDGTDSDADIKFVSRSDFEGTFPKEKAAQRAKATNVIDAAKVTSMNNSYDTDTAPVQGVAGDLALTHTVDGELKYNEELITDIGANYDSKTWDDLLSQITVAEMSYFVEQGGFQNVAIASIAKPNLTDLDGPSGLNQGVNSADEFKATAFPVPTVLASTFNEVLSYAFGKSVATEGAENSVAGWYAPGANLHRSPFGGRNFEYYSEDPLLSGLICAQSIHGATENGLYAYVKHFAINETETSRGELYTWLTEQSLREIYLKGFEIGLKKGKGNAVMSSFNRIGATWAGTNYALLTEVLRDEWGFKGGVVTDYVYMEQYMTVDGGLRAGNDLWLNGLNQSLSSLGIFKDKTSATAITCMRKATKNLLYMYTNTIYQTANATGFENMQVREAADHAPLWWFYIAAFDLVALGGVGVWVYFSFFRKKKEATAENAEA